VRTEGLVRRVEARFHPRFRGAQAVLLLHEGREDLGAPVRELADHRDAGERRRGHPAALRVAGVVAESAGVVLLLQEDDGGALEDLVRHGVSRVASQREPEERELRVAHVDRISRVAPESVALRRDELVEARARGRAVERRVERVFPCRPGSAHLAEAAKSMSSTALEYVLLKWTVEIERSPAKSALSSLPTPDFTSV
jgi:hypothetical protein